MDVGQRQSVHLSFCSSSRTVSWRTTATQRSVFWTGWTSWPSPCRSSASSLPRPSPPGWRIKSPRPTGNPTPSSWWVTHAASAGRHRQPSQHFGVQRDVYWPALQQQQPITQSNVCRSQDKAAEPLVPPPPGTPSITCYCFFFAFARPC